MMFYSAQGFLQDDAYDFLESFQNVCDPLSNRNTIVPSLAHKKALGGQPTPLNVQGCANCVVNKCTNIDGKPCNTVDKFQKNCKCDILCEKCLKFSCKNSNIDVNTACPGKRPPKDNISACVWGTATLTTQHPYAPTYEGVNFDGQVFLKQRCTAWDSRELNATALPLMYTNAREEYLKLQSSCAPPS